MTTTLRPAYYAVSTGTGGLRDWVSVLHPPYTAWHLSYVGIGAAVAPRFADWRLLGTLLAFFLAVGVAAHALDELHGRPLRTGIPAPLLLAAALVGVAVPVGVGWWYAGLRLLPFMLVGVALVLAYNLELGGDGVHNAVVFALGWGAFPVLTGCYAQTFGINRAAVLAAAAAFLLSFGQRALSTFVRDLRRRTVAVAGHLERSDGTVTVLTREVLLAPAEAALRWVGAGVVVLAVALVVARS